MPGGDHHQLLGIDKLAGGADQVVDTSGACKAGIRIRSGGRAATFLVRDEYHFEASNLQSSMLEVSATTGGCEQCGYELIHLMCPVASSCFSKCVKIKLLHRDASSRHVTVPHDVTLMQFRSFCVINRDTLLLPR